MISLLLLVLLLPTCVYISICVCHFSPKALIREKKGNLAMYMYYSIDDHEANKVNKKVLVIITIEDDAERMSDFPFLFFLLFI